MYMAGKFVIHSSEQNLLKSSLRECSILSAELTKKHSFKLFFLVIFPTRIIPNVSLKYGGIKGKTTSDHPSLYVAIDLINNHSKRLCSSSLVHTDEFSRFIEIEKNCFFF